MTSLLYVNLYSSKSNWVTVSYLINKINITFTKRSMFTSKTSLKNIIFTRRFSQPQIYPKFYKAGFYKETENLRYSDGSKLTQYEITHAIIVNDNTTEAYGLLTSAKKNKSYFKPQLLQKGSNYNNEPKDQMIAEFSKPRYFSSERFKEDPIISQFIKNKEVVLDQLLQNVKKVKPICVVHSTDLSKNNTPKDDEVFN
jgi:hypothetical protein